MQYRSSGLGGLPPVTKYLLIINCFVFLCQWLLRQQEIFLEQWGALFDWRSSYFNPYQLVTHMFMHSNWMHLLFNMFGLWTFGSILESFWGPKRFLQFYVICGLVAGLTHLALATSFFAVGASGAIMGLFAGFAYLFPNTQLYLMFIPVPIKAKYLIPALMALDLFGGFAQIEGDNIAHWAHLGGAIAGLLIVIVWNKTNRRNFY